MKIIGTAGDGKLMLTATVDELANFIGYYYAGSDLTENEQSGRDRRTARDVLRVGNEINVHGMYRQLRELESKEREMKECAAKLRVCADTIELTSPVIWPPKEEAP